MYRSCGLQCVGHASARMLLLLKCYCCSNDFKISREFPIGDGLAEFSLFPLPGGGVVLDEFVAEQGARGLGSGEALGSLVQRGGQAPVRRVLAVVGIALDGGVGLDAVLDAPEAGADGGGECNVGIDVGGGDAVFDALTGGAAADHAQRRGAILDAPGGGGGRPV